MERFKPWKELVLALRSIADAIEGGNDSEGSGEIDNTIYVYNGANRIILVNRNFDNSKFSLEFNNPSSLETINLLGDILNQEGVDILNNIIDFLIGENSYTYAIAAFLTHDGEGTFFPIFLLTKTNNKIRLQGEFLFGKYFETTEKFSVNDEVKTEEQH